MSSVMKKLMMGLLKKKWQKLTVMVLFVLLGSTATFLMGWVLKGIVSGGLENDLWLFLLAITALGVGTGGRIWASKGVVADSVFALREQVYANAMNADMEFHNKHDTGYLSSIFQDIYWLEGTLNSLVVFFVRNISLFVGSLILMIYIDYLLSFYVLCGIGFMAFFYSKLIRSQVKKRMSSYKNSLDTLSLTALDSWRGIEAIRSFNAIQAFIEGFVKTTLRIRKHLTVSIIWQSISAVIGVVSIALFFVGILYLSIGQINQGDATPSSLVAFFFYLLVMIGTLASAGENIYNVQELLIVLRRLSDFFDTSSLHFAKNRKTLTAPKGNVAVKFDGVGFCYNKGHHVLKDLCFQVEKGKNLAIMGVSGSGKSSILRIIAGLYAPSAGTALVSESPPLVGQNPVIFNDSLWNNLSCVLGDLDKGRAEYVMQKLELRYLIERIGWDGVLGEAGTILSGGERQRLALARALLSGSSTCLFDEVTSSLDTQIEQLVLDFVFGESRGKTLIFATHSLGVAERCDKIILLQRGRILAAGNPQEISSSQAYEDFIHFQSFLEN